MATAVWSPEPINFLPTSLCPLLHNEQRYLKKRPGIYDTTANACDVIPPLSAQDSDSLDRSSTFIQRLCSISFDVLTKYNLTNVLTLVRHAGHSLSDFYVWFEAVPAGASCIPFVHYLDNHSCQSPECTNST
jgi:hypothetical protein